MTKKIIGLLLLTLLTSKIYASYPQTVNLCLDVRSNSSPFNFRAGFASTDKFDRGSGTSTIYRGKTCVSHTYGHGPKSIYTGVYAYDGTSNVLINTDASCAGFYNRESGYVTAGYQKTSTPMQTWNFVLIQTEPKGAFDNVFDLKCEHTGN